MGEGWGEGQKGSISTSYLPLPLIPSHKGRGNGTFYEFIKYVKQRNAVSITQNQLWRRSNGILS